MKALFRVFIVLTCGFMLFVSCKKDGDTTPEPTPEEPVVHDTLYYVKYLGTKYEIDKCHVFKEDVWGSNGFDYIIYLASTNVSYLGSPINEISGTGNGIRLSVHSDNSSFFYHSTYATDTTGTPTDLFYLRKYCDLFINQDFFFSGTYISLVSGNCTLVNLGSDVYELSANLIKSPNIPINIYYKGSIPIHPAND